MSQSESWLSKRLPILRWLPRYEWSDLPNDITAGLTLSTIVVPQSIAYALLADLPPSAGLYSSVVPVAIYTLLGTCPHLNIGTFALTSQVVRSSLDALCGPHADGAYTARLQAVSLLTLLTGALMLLAAVCRVGRVLHRVLAASEPFLGGFIAGAAFQIMASQLPAFFGLKFPDIDGQPAALFRKLYYLFTHTNLIRWSEVIVAMSCLLLMFVVKACSARYREFFNHVPLPDALIALIASTLVCWRFELHSTYGVSVIGHVPHGLPAFQDVAFDWSSWVNPTLSTPTTFWLALCSRAMVLAILCSMMSLSVAVKFAKQFNYEKQLDATQELFSLGLAGTIGAFFQSFVPCSSLSRSTVLAASHARTNLANGIQVIVMMLVLLLLTPAFEFVCRAALAAVIIFAFSSLLSQLSIGQVYWRLDRAEFWAWCLSLVVVLLFDVEIGLAAGLVFGAISLAYRKTHPMIELLALRSDSIHETSTSVSQSASIALQCLTRQPQPIEQLNVPQYTPLGSEHDSVLGPTNAPSALLSMLCCQSPTVVFETSPLHGLQFVRVHVPITQTLAEHLPRLIAGLLPERSSLASSEQNDSYQIQSSDEVESTVLIIECVGWCDLDAETERQLDLLPTKLTALLPHLSIAVHLVCSSGMLNNGMSFSSLKYHESIVAALQSILS